MNTHFQHQRRAARAIHDQAADLARTLYQSRKTAPTPAPVTTQEAWGNRTISTLITPVGMMAENYLAILNSCRRYTYPSFSIQNGQVIEENYYSIGD